MDYRGFWRTAALAAGVLAAAGAAWAAAGDAGRGVKPEELKPQWRLGQQWVVETATRQTQADDPRKARSRGRPIRWRFTVEGIEQLDGRPCFRIAIRCLLPGPARPASTLWVDRRTLAIRQFQTRVPVQGRFRTITESYQFAGGQASPVFVPLAALPLDLPVLESDGSKGAGTFSYRAISGPAGTKAVGEPGFAIDVQQRFSRPETEHVKGLLDDEFAKDLQLHPAVEVQLTGPGRRVRQLWQAGRPWPVYADNGVTEARLIRADQAESGAGEAEGSERRGGRSSDGDDSSKALEQARLHRDDSTKALEQARAEVIPWSGYWWPLREGRIFGPLAKYDRITGRRASAWERRHHPPRRDVPSWHGYCHAWAASAVMEAEPNEPRGATDRSGSRVGLGIGDQKGLLALCHTQDVANSYGDRFGDGEGSEDEQDLAPDVLWHLLKLYVKQNGVPLVLDIEAGPEVWNYPVYAYELNHGPQRDSGRQMAELGLLMADNGVPPDFCGHVPRRQTYRFTFELRDGAVVMGSGRWIGRSREDHPDFAWFPYVAVAENPEMDYAAVHQMVYGTAPAAPEPEPSPQPPETQPPAAPGPGPVVAASPPPSGQPPAAPAVGQLTGGNDRPAQRPVVISPMELVALIANKTSSFGLEATVDRFDGGTYRVGEQFFVRCASGRAGYLYLILVEPDGVPRLLHPLGSADNRVPEDRSVTIPHGAPKRRFGVPDVPGVARLKAVVTTRPLILTGATPAAQQQAVGGSPRPAQQKPGWGTFRWHPTQRRQIQRLLSGQGVKPPAEQPRAADPRELLGPFAQDEVAFHVEKRGQDPAQAPSGAAGVEALRRPGAEKNPLQ